MEWDYEWDEDKAESNLAKHGVAFSKAIEILAGETLERIDDRQDYGEIRNIAMGNDRHGRLHVVAFTERAGSIRIISARKANDRETAWFERMKKGKTDEKG